MVRDWIEPVVRVFLICAEVARLAQAAAALYEG
jgi:hypothetical protein